MLVVLTLDVDNSLGPPRLSLKTLCRQLLHLQYEKMPARYHNESSSASTSTSTSTSASASAGLNSVRLNPKY